MASAESWKNFIFVNIAFFIYILGVFYYGQMIEIKENWPIHRCNPIYMPLADNVNENFVYCIQKMQYGFMGYLLLPITFITSVIGKSLAGFVEQLNSARGMFSNMRGFIPNIFNNIFNSFSVLIIEFQRIAIGIKDIMGKTTGVVVTVMHILDGSIKTMGSGVNFIRGIGRCFHPDTLIELKNGTIKCMKDMELCEVLKNGSIVESVMKIDNKKAKIPFYTLKGMGANGSDIYVTGTHFIYDETTSKFVQIKDYKNAQKQTDVSSEWFSCLITDDHRIQIGENVFWDWEDYLLRM
jgi:hypothetical protein